MADKKQYGWAYVVSEYGVCPNDQYNEHDLCDSVEACIDTAKKTIDDYRQKNMIDRAFVDGVVPQNIRVAKVLPFIPDVDAESIVDSIDQTQLIDYEDTLDWWIDEMWKPETIDAIQNALQPVFLDTLKKLGLMPEAWLYVDDEMFPLD